MKESKKEQKKEEVSAEETKKTSETVSEQTEKTEKKSEACEADSEKKEEKPAEPTDAEKIAELEKQVEELKKDALYRAAENDNWRKRMIAQKDEALAYANASLLGDLLESLDNFDRTIEAAATATDPKTIADGVKMISSNLVKMLEDKYGLVGYGAEGDEFNPDEHEAIGRVEDENCDKETLAQVYLKGYKLKDRVIRHAKVMVKVPKQ